MINTPPLGATVHPNGTYFALFSAHATAVELCLFDEHGVETRFRLPERDGAIWHGFIPHVGAGQRYGYRVDGVYAPEKGLYFNPQKLLLDPYSKAIDGTAQFRNADELAWFRPEDGRDNAHLAPKSVVVGASDFDWGDDAHPNTPMAKTVIYEAHVKGLTQKFPDLAHAGTYRALADERVIEYLRNLGITAIELLPIQVHLDERHLQAAGLSNYWGYNTLSHFAPEPRYAANPMQAADELRFAVKALHRAGIEVILDVVYNHSAEQDSTGAMLCQRGIDNRSWYWLDSQGDYVNWTGCGNTLNFRQREVCRWAMDSLRYWVEAFHIDGFRFDLGATMARQPEFDATTGFFAMLYQDPVLCQRKMIVEAWDIHGYHLGAFVEPFAEWNGAFRDDMRRFWCHQNGDLATFATRFAGSSDIFQHHGRRPSASLNFITAHDGFTLRDLVSYQDKHNEANGEHNRDGHHDNISHNHGVEGDTDIFEINQLRKYTSKALLASLFLANGVPMLLAGDEWGHTQRGNNNAYCQDNAMTWLNWQNVADYQEIHDYVQHLIALRGEISLLNENQWFDDERVRWLNAEGVAMSADDWHHRERKTMMILIDNQWLIIINGQRGAARFRLPEWGNVWRCRSAPCDDVVCLEAILAVEQMGVWVFQAA